MHRHLGIKFLTIGFVRYVTHHINKNSTHPSKQLTNNSENANQIQIRSDFINHMLWRGWLVHCLLGYNHEYVSVSLRIQAKCHVQNSHYRSFPSVATRPMRLTTFIPSLTRPKIVCLPVEQNVNTCKTFTTSIKSHFHIPSNQGVGAKVMKN
jgi:hypothetical protein